MWITDKILLNLENSWDQTYSPNRSSAMKRRAKGITEHDEKEKPQNKLLKLTRLSICLCGIGVLKPGNTIQVWPWEIKQKYKNQKILQNPTPKVFRIDDIDTKESGKKTQSPRLTIIKISNPWNSCMHIQIAQELIKIQIAAKKIQDKSKWKKYTLKEIKGR